MTATSPDRPSATMRQALAVIDFRRLWLAQLGSELGDWAARIGITFLVWTQTASALATGLIVGMSFLPALGPGQWLTMRLQRFPARSVMIALDLMRAGAFAILVLAPSVPMALTVAFVTGCLAIPFNSLRAAILPEVTGSELLVPGLKVIQSSQDGAVILGYAIGGALAGATSGREALGFNVATFLFSAALLVGLRCPAARRALPAEDRVNLRAGVRAITSRPAVAAAVSLAVLAFSAGVAIESVVVPVAARFSDRPTLPTALLAGMAAVSLLATLMIPGRLSGASLLWATLALFAIPSSLITVLLVVSSGYLPLAALALSGVLFAAPVPASALAAELLPQGSRAAVFAVVTGAICAGQGCATAVAGWAYDRAGLPGLAGLTATLALAGGVIGVRAWAARSRSGQLTLVAVANPAGVTMETHELLPPAADLGASAA